MSFDKLTVAIRKQETVEIETTSGTIKFHANELSYTQRMTLFAMSERGEDVFNRWVSLSITDQDGKRMTMEQANSLPDDVLEKMLAAVMAVNQQVSGEEKKS